MFPPGICTIPGIGGIPGIPGRGGIGKLREYNQPRKPSLFLQYKVTSNDFMVGSNEVEITRSVKVNNPQPLLIIGTSMKDKIKQS